MRGVSTFLGELALAVLFVIFVGLSALVGAMVYSALGG